MDEGETLLPEYNEFIFTEILTGKGQSECEREGRV